MSRIKANDHPVFGRPDPAISILENELGISADDAFRGLRALVKAGYVIAPREPTNAMLDAYFTSYGTPPTRTHSAIIGIGKARVRWAAMAEVGTAMALSRYRLNHATGSEGHPRSLDPDDERNTL